MTPFRCSANVDGCPWTGYRISAQSAALADQPDDVRVASRAVVIAGEVRETGVAGRPGDEACNRDPQLGKVRSGGRAPFESAPSPGGRPGALLDAVGARVGARLPSGLYRPRYIFIMARPARRCRCPASQVGRGQSGLSTPLCTGCAQGAICPPAHRRRSSNGTVSGPRKLQTRRNRASTNE
jgi:hypothetical protein